MVLCVLRSDNKSWFIIEKDLALPIDVALFNQIMAAAKPLGLSVYEQDWICLTHMKMNCTQVMLQ